MTVDLSRDGECKTFRLEDSNIESRRLNRLRQVNYPQSTNKFLPLYRRKAKFKASAESEAHSFQIGPEINGKSIGAALNVIYRYSRAYTLKGTVLSIVSICLLAVQRLTDITPSFSLGVLQAVIGGCLANLFVVGINQLSDIEIDKVNKPHLPLPSGELSVKSGVLITTLYALLISSLAKMNVTLQIHIYGRPLLLSKHAIFVFGIMSVYTTVLAVFKDIPDVEGDKINGINSFASRFGSKRVFWICVWLLETVYAAAILTGISSARFWIRLIMTRYKPKKTLHHLIVFKVTGHSILGFILWRNANLVDLNSNEAIESFYLFIWKLYYAEYLLVPFLRF
ncbi:ubiA prenyltransferase family [Artemisia annua]|uniref:UbiA prenyltransferase family n=1 Tax=Artemisia annua TaxID=35608 RepID=A0A2U1LSC7_ARTAN|nr:ubiA prenyltransferase family [Artemisia annua]